MAQQSVPREHTDITQVINEIGQEVSSVLNSRKKGKYFEEIILLYSFIENLLKWLVAMKMLWQKCDKELSEEEVGKLRSFCRDLHFYNAQGTAFCIGAIDLDLCKRIDSVRTERNDVVHQFWMYGDRNNPLVLRKKLEKLAGVANQLVGVFNQLTEEIGVDEVYQMFL